MVKCPNMLIWISNASRTFRIPDFFYKAIQRFAEFKSATGRTNISKKQSLAYLDSEKLMIVW